MTDIVDRLVDVAQWETLNTISKPEDHIAWKAAHEIERLRKRVAELEAGDILDKDLRTYNGY